MLRVCRTILPCHIRGWGYFAFANREALLTYGKTVNDGVSLGFLLLVQLVKLEQGDVGNVAFVIHAVVVGKIIQV